MSSSHPSNRYQPSLEERIAVLLLRTADFVGQQSEQLLKSHGLTGTQYNVLRILRGAGPEGLPCKSVGDRMISHDPDMTRLLDRMEKRGLISRERQKDDRRVIKTRVTPQGLEILKKLDTPVREMHKGQFAHMSVARLKQLVELLEEIRKRESEESSEAS
jgi:MarR family transcriptional regulator, organic hydroperoxide resistance regulator